MSHGTLKTLVTIWHSKSRHGETVHLCDVHLNRHTLVCGSSFFSPSPSLVPCFSSSPLVFSHIMGQFHSWAMANQCVCAPIPIFSRMRVFLCTFTTNLALFSPWTYRSSLPLSSHLGSSSIGCFVVYVLLWIGSNPIQDGYGEEISKTQQSWYKEISSAFLMEVESNFSALSSPIEIRMYA